MVESQMAEVHFARFSGVLGPIRPDHPPDFTTALTARSILFEFGPLFLYLHKYYILHKICIFRPNSDI